MSGTVQTPLKILIAEDSAPDRLILETIIADSGHEPIAVENGLQAVDAFNKNHPDIVLLDVLMPRMGGLEVASIIRELAGDELIPIIFLTSLSDTSSIINCLEAGGDDFVPKPYNKVVLQSKLKAYARMREMHRTLSVQKNAIELNHQHLLEEQRVARQVFDRVAHSGSLALKNLRNYLSPMAVFNGDILVAEISPRGSLVAMLGDFTGHGLPAAIGSLPLASTFYSMVRKGFNVTDVLNEVNSKLHEILPVGLFCCAICIDINFSSKRLRIWGGGLPDLYLYRKKTDNYQLIKSSHLPLGVLSRKQFNAQTTRIDVDYGDRLFMWSDGILEARNSEGEMFGVDRLDALMNDRRQSPDLFDNLLDEVHKHIGDSEKDDDISLVEIEVRDIELKPPVQTGMFTNTGSLADWYMHFELGPSSLRSFDPLPMVVNILSESPNLREHGTALYTVIAEIYTNALEHGILGLDSSLKSTPKGFSEYYQRRTQALTDIDSGEICFDIRHVVGPDGGELMVTVTDTGPGYPDPGNFFIDGKPQVTPKIKGVQKNYHGRGMNLLSNICDLVTVYPPGNKVEVIFRWCASEEF